MSSALKLLELVLESDMRHAGALGAWLTPLALRTSKMELKLDGSTSAAAEATYKIASGDLKLAAGATTKLDSGHTARLVLSSAGNAQCTYSGEVAKGLQGTACAQVDQALKYKYGLQFNYKI